MHVISSFLPFTTMWEFNGNEKRYTAKQFKKYTPDLRNASVV